MAVEDLRQAPRVAALALLVLLAAPACSAWQAATFPVSGSAERLSGEVELSLGPAIASGAPLRFSRDRAMKHVRRLASRIGVRTKGSRNERRAARYMADKMRAYGYEVRIQRFEVNGKTSRNVVARWPGAISHPFVVGGHIDSVPGSPGANDNASGTAAVIELARIFAGTRQAKWVTFVGFGAEEYDSSKTSHHDGSRHYVSRLDARGRERVPGMISVDMVADGRPLLVGNSAISGRHRVANSFYNTLQKKGIAAKRITLCDCSDHGPFEHAGMDAAFAYSGPEPDYHSSSDTVGNLKPRDVLRTGRALRAYLIKLDKRYVNWLRAS